jgi:NTE family protein
MKMHIETHPNGTRESQPVSSSGKAFGQTVLVLQGGGALGAYQLGVYQAMHEAGIEPDWVVGTSIGAINGAIIAGNHPGKRMARLHEFWDRMELNKTNPFGAFMNLLGNSMTNMSTIMNGVPGFFAPNPSALMGQHANVGIERASYYTTGLLRETLSDLIDFEYLQSKKTRFTVGAVNANTGAMRYFDNREGALTVEHVMASGALPPAFPAVRIDGEPYWDGGIYSNTPVEVVLDDNPRRDSTIFAVQLWNPHGPEPTSLWRANSHIANQQKIHKLRHIIRELNQHIPDKLRNTPDIKELAAWGCGTTMHVVRMVAPRIAGEDHTKDIDFTGQGIRTRWLAGYEDTQRAIVAAPWQQPVDCKDGVVIHDFESKTA